MATAEKDKKIAENDWRELDSTLNKHEIKFTGDVFNEKLSQSGGVLPRKLFLLSTLNFLELSHSTFLTEIPSEIGELKELTNLILRSNNLTKLPSSFGNLKKLKYLDVSSNQILEIPSEIEFCQELQTLNFSHNKISKIPENFANLIHLAHFDLSFNEFFEFPQQICAENLQHLAEINLKSNKITSIPTGINFLVALKILNLAENLIEIVPGELGDCAKLKEIYLENNKLKDKRLAKLIVQCQQKSILDYIKKNCPKLKISTEKSAQKTPKSDVKKKKDNKQLTKTDDGQETIPKDKIIILPNAELKITLNSDALADLRPFLLCCILKNLDLTDAKKLKKFITLQSKIHDEECKKRVAATIATHDLAKIRDPLIFTSKIPEEILIQPLSRQNECSADELMAKLTDEAETLRKEKKRNVYSGIHQYLYLLKEKPKYPCLIDRENCVISFPPITNSDLTKITSNTTDVLVEVSSSQNFATCKRVLEILLKEILNLNLTKTATSDEKITSKSLTVQQVKIYDEKETLKATFPSKTDLQFEDVELVRDWMKNED